MIIIKKTYIFLFYVVILLSCIKNNDDIQSSKKNSYFKNYYISSNEKIIDKKNKFGGLTLEVVASHEQKEKYSIEKYHYFLDGSEGNPYKIVTFYVPEYSKKTGILKIITISDFRGTSETIEYNIKNQIIKKEVYYNEFTGQPNSIKLLRTEIYKDGKIFQITTNR